MPATIGAGVSLQGVYDPKFNHVWNVSGAVTLADVSKAVSQDITADATAKLCLAGERIIGSLFSFEDRRNEGIKIGTISRKGYFVFTYTGANPTRGHGIVGGATAGLVAGTGAVAISGQPCVIAIDTVLKQVLVEVGL